MVFTSAFFLFVFLPVTIALYSVASAIPGVRVRNLVLLTMSLAFYAWSGVGFCLLLMASTVVNYLFGFAIDRAENAGCYKKKKIVFVGVITYNLLILGIFKYFNFFADNLESLIRLGDPLFELGAPNIALPVGISFYTFQILSYQIDLYRGNANVQNNVLDLGLYIMLFPQLIAGPIVRYVDVEREIGSRRTSLVSFGHGVRRFMIGFSKKVLLADRAGYMAEELLALETIAMPWAWVAMACYALQLYLDFSAYSDMAIGLGEMFGFHFLENFRYPYCSRSIQEFWQRWHISLSGWFRDYVYIPLGGSRCGRKRTYINVLIVFCLTGIWHGAGWTFLIWGLIHGILICFERAGGAKILAHFPNMLRRLYVCLTFAVSLVFFYYDKLEDSMRQLGRMFSFNLERMWDIEAVGLFNREILFFLVIGMIACTPICPWLKEKIGDKADMAADFAVPAIFVMAVCYMMSSGFNPFIYFRF